MYCIDRFPPHFSDWQVVRLAEINGRDPWFCYECVDGNCKRCVGVPCDCDCMPAPEQDPDPEYFI